MKAAEEKLSEISTAIGVYQLDVEERDLKIEELEKENKLLQESEDELSNKLEKEQFDHVKTYEFFESRLTSCKSKLKEHEEEMAKRDEAFVRLSNSYDEKDELCDSLQSQLLTCESRVKEMGEAIPTEKDMELMQEEFIKENKDFSENSLLESAHYSGFRDCYRWITALLTNTKK